MGAVALLEKDEILLESLRKILKIPSKSQVVHRALLELKQIVERDQLKNEISSSVEKCREADFVEHRWLSEAAVLRKGS